MRFTVITIFPEIVSAALSRGVIGNALAAGTIHLDFQNPRDFVADVHRSVDDSPYGGGPGMVMQVGPLVEAIEAARQQSQALRICMSPSGKPLTQKRVRELAMHSHLILICGRYEGIDERVAQLAVDEQVSIGDFVLSGGELAAACLIDAVGRHVTGVLGEASSLEEESFSHCLLEYPQYTRPRTFRGVTVPEVLHSGDHEWIRRWRRTQALERTARQRPDLWRRYRTTPEDEVLLTESKVNLARRTYIALVHYPVYDRERSVVTTSITTLDVHDIARSAATFGLAGYYVVSPIQVQRDKVKQSISVWESERVTSPQNEAAQDNRIRALHLVRTADRLEAAVEQIEQTWELPQSSWQHLPELVLYPEYQRSRCGTSVFTMLDP